MLQRHTVQITSSSTLISAFARDSTADLAAGLGGHSICEDALMHLRSSRSLNSMKWRSSSSVAVSSISSSRISSSCWRASNSVLGSGCSPSTISLSCLTSIKKRNCIYMLGSLREIASTRARQAISQLRPWTICEGMQSSNA
ncbi:hypothetical protein AMTRI_Chr07g81650 [Amborella trichopoda]